MVSGGTALKNFLAPQDWTKFKESLSFKIKRNGIYYRSTFPDIDIFLLGKNKKKICYELLNEIYKSNLISKYPDIVECISFIDYDYDIPNCKNPLCNCTTESSKKSMQFKIRKGICEIHMKYKRKLIKLNNKIKLTSCSFYYQILLQKDSNTPNDIFCTFDLDCCKIGWFPGLKKVVCSIDFIRSLTSKVNYCDLVFGISLTKNKNRIVKYFTRTFIQTSMCHPPLFSHYHTHYQKDQSIPQNGKGIYIAANNISLSIAGNNISLTIPSFFDQSSSSFDAGKKYGIIKEKKIYTSEIVNLELKAHIKEQSVGVNNGYFYNPFKHFGINITQETIDNNNNFNSVNEKYVYKNIDPNNKLLKLIERKILIKSPVEYIKKNLI